MADGQHTCRACGKQFTPNKNDRLTCCSRECGWRWIHFKRSAYAHSFRVFVRSRRSKPKPRVWASTLPDLLLCRACGASYKPKSSGGRPSVYCSERCKAVARMSQRRTEKQKRRAAARGVFADAIDPLSVFARDGWKCGICGKRTPEARRGSHHPRAPELDHIVALANGGTHTWNNVQCCCRECNGRKGATNFGQLMLFPVA